MDAVVLQRVGLLEYFCPKQGQGFKPSAAPLHPNMGQVPPRALDEYLTPLLVQSFTSRMASKLKTDKRRSYLEEGITTAENQVALNAFVMALKS